MNTYDSMTKSILNYLNDHGYCSVLIKSNERCFQKLGAYLTENNISYSPKTAWVWFEQAEDLAQSDKRHVRVALIRLQDLAETGAIRREHETKHLMSYTILTDPLKNSLEEYLLHISAVLAETTVDNHRHSCAKFLAFAQNHGVCKINDISAGLIAAFYDDAIYFGIYNKLMVNSNVASMMSFFYESGQVPYSCTLILHYLSHGKHQGCFWNEISSNAHTQIQEIMQYKETIDSGQLLKYKKRLVQIHRDNGYSKVVVCLNSRIIDLLILFLEMNGYRYNPEIAEIWFEAMQPRLGTQAASAHRVLCMTADYHRNSQMSLETVYRNKKPMFYQLPVWCMEIAEKYVESKAKEGWAESTLCMIRSSITRFCTYLDSQGVHSFREISASHIKGFNASDHHKTPQGKNAYNVRIRKFLIYLGERQYLENPMLFIALPCVSAPKETIVVILTAEEMDELQGQLDAEDSRLSLRKKAMLLLGLKMGLRSSDIVNLSIDDISWKTASVRFVQEKTSVEVRLPMPTEVGNALFRYITEERRKSSSPKIFLTENAPYRPVGRTVCGKALKTALPDRNVDGSGFHVTRKTYATSLLRNGVGAGMVAEALGQRGTASVSRYLSLDADRMRMCSLSLSECEIGGWNHE